jgi:exopolyphosphatase/guanosine-5'-triphosphate,3'-diphosphate pyrophosphatase
MLSERRAVIDVGTNSVKLLVADVRDGAVHPVVEESEQTRLGAGFYEGRRLQPGAIALTAKAAGAFAAKARELGAVAIRVIATSAARDALNPGDLTTTIETASGIKVEIISGEQEADWAFQGVTTDAELARQPLLLLDVGGGSTEFILGEGGRKYFSGSFQLGTVRMLEYLPPSDPPSGAELADSRGWTRHFLRAETQPRLEPALRPLSETRGPEAVQLVGTGGTSTILARMEANLEDFDRARIEGMRLTLAQVRAHVERLWGLPLADRQQITGLPKKRADVILPGVVIYEAVMELFGFSNLRISTRGLRFAALLE